MSELTVEVLHDFSNLTLRDILSLEYICFPVEWHYPDVEKYYTSILKDKRNIIILMKEAGKTVGYILSVPHKVVRTELLKYDSKIKADNARYYIETIGVLPQYRRKGGATKLINAMCREGKRRGIYKFSIHARTINKLNILIKNVFENMITETRYVERWFFGGDEPYEYIEWTYDKNYPQIKKIVV